MNTQRAMADLPAPERALAVARVLIVSFVMGLVTISVAAFALAGSGGVGGGGAPSGGSGGAGSGGVALDVLLVAIGGVLLAGSFVVGRVSRALFVRRARARAIEAEDVDGGEANLTGVFVGWTLMRGASAEGAGLLGAVAAIITGSLWALALPAAAIAVLLVGVFPKRSDYGRFVDDALADG
ncbi:MAG: hypothetical protein AAFP26_06695 [Planctomycetota bacterium]